MKIHHPSPGVLQISHSRAGAAAQLAFFVLFYAAWYSFLLTFSRASGQSVAPPLFLLLFWVVPLMSVPQIIQQIRVITKGETFTLNRSTGVTDRNGVHRARFSEVTRIQIRTISDPESSDVYRLSLVLADDAKLKIAQSGDQDETALAAAARLG